MKFCINLSGVCLLGVLLSSGCATPPVSTVSTDYIPVKSRSFQAARYNGDQQEMWIKFISGVEVGFEQVAPRHKAHEHVSGDLDVTLRQGHQDCLLVGEVLVKGPDGDPGPLGDVVGGRPGVSPFGKNLSSGLDNLLHSEPRALLSRRFSWIYSFFTGHMRALSNASCQIASNYSYLIADLACERKPQDGRVRRY